MNFIDTDGADMLKKIAEAGRELHIDLHLARVKPHVLAVLEKDDAIAAIGADRIHPDIASAVEFHRARYPRD